MSNPSYAPNPKKQPVYTNLQNKTLADVEAADIQKLTDPTFIQATNQDALMTYNTINKAAMRDGLPMPETSVIVVASATESGTAVTVKSPNRGEVYMILNAHVSVSGGSGSIAHEFYFTDNNNSRSMLWFYNSSTSSNLTLQQDTDWTPPFFFDSNQVFTYEATGTFTTSQLSIMMIRVR